MSPARGLRLVRHDRDLLADERVHERRLADVRSSDDGDDPGAERRSRRYSSRSGPNAAGSSSPIVHRARSPATCSETIARVGAELPQHLPAPAARRRRRDRRRRRPPRPRSVARPPRPSPRRRCAPRTPTSGIARVLDVHAGERPPAGEHGGADREPAVRRVGPCARLARGRDQTRRGRSSPIGLTPCTTSPIPLAVRVRAAARSAPSRSAGPGPPPRGTSAPGTPPRRRSSGILPNRSSIEAGDRVPFLVGQLDVEQLVHVVDRGLPRHAVHAVAHGDQLGLLAVVLVGDLARRAPPAGPRASRGRATDPYSSVTIAMWNFSFCISRRSSATFFVSGTKCGLAHDLGQRAVVLALVRAPSGRPSRRRCRRRRRGPRGRRGRASSRARAPAPGRRAASCVLASPRCRAAAPSPRARSCRRTRRSSGSAPSPPPRSRPPRTRPRRRRGSPAR